MKLQWIHPLIVFAITTLLTAPVRAGDGQIDIASLPFLIEGPGSYVVVRDLSLTDPDTNGILVASDNVTLDLNGHTLSGPGPETGTIGSGVMVEHLRSGIAVRNGVFRGWRGYGVEAKIVDNSSFENLRCSANGRAGIGAEGNCVIRGNTCRGNGGSGIDAGTQCVISNNACTNNDGLGIFAGSDSTVTNNLCSWNAQHGIGTSYGSLVSGNACNYNLQSGISATDGVLVSNNSCYQNDGHGVTVREQCRVVDNSCAYNGHEPPVAGIHAFAANNTIERNSCTDNVRGLYLESTGNVVRENVLKGNQTALVALPDNQLDILISDLPFIIGVPGNYRVTGRLHFPTPDSDGITVQANNVTLDLGGNALVGPGKTTGTAGRGILVDVNFTDVVIRNGTIRDWRQAGVFGYNAVNVRYEGLRLSQNGEDGLVAGTASIITRCGAENNGGNGIAASSGSVVENSVSYGNGELGIEGTGSTVRGNTCYNNTTGIYGSAGSTVTNNTCRDNSFAGIVAMDGCLIEGNTCATNANHGIDVSTNCRVVGNLCSRNGVDAAIGYGIRAYDTGNDVEGNTVVENDTGIVCTSGGNYVASNRAGKNAINYSIVGGNTVGTGDLANITY